MGCGGLSMDLTFELLAVLEDYTTTEWNYHEWNYTTTDTTRQIIAIAIYTYSQFKVRTDG